MKRIVFTLLSLSVILGLTSCNVAWPLFEEDAKTSVEVVSSAVFGSIGDDASRLFDESSRGLSITTTLTQNEGEGTAKYTLSSDENNNVSEHLSGWFVFHFNILYSDFKVTLTDEEDEETDYILNGMMYMEYKMVASEQEGYSIGREVLCFTDPEAEEALRIEGDGINTALELQIRNTVAMNFADNGFSFTAQYTGECNGQKFEKQDCILSASIE